MTAPQLAWSEDGARGGASLIMGSSLGTTHAMWHPTLGAIDGVRIISFDHLGHGGSAVPQGPYSMAQLGTAVLELMDHLGIERASYAGLSLGGAIGQWLAIHHPNRIDRLVLLATAAYFPDPASWRERAATARRDGLTGIAGSAMGRWFNDRYRDENPDEVERWRAMLAGTPAEGYAGCCEALAGFDARDSLAAITAPTLAIAGADDPSTSPESMRPLADAIADSRLEVIDDSAHLVNIPHPAQVGRLIAEHVRGQL